MLTIGIVGHTSRAPEAKALAIQVEADFVSIDNGSLGCDDNHEAVLHHLAQLPSTWSVVLEDDAQPISGFRNQLHSALIVAPSPIVSLYLGRQRPPQWQRRITKALAKADEHDANWIVATNLLHAVGYCIKTELLPSLLSHTTPFPVDQHISNWARTYGYTVSYTTPSLVDHADQDTIVEHPDGQPRPPGRTAWTVGQRNTWTNEAVTLV